MTEMRISELDMVIETRTGIVWVVTKVDGQMLELVRNGHFGKVHGALYAAEVERVEPQQ